MLDRTVADYDKCGIKISVNDALRIMVRRAFDPPPMTYELACARAVAHWEACPWCDDSAIRCPDGQRIRQQIIALDRRNPPPAQAPAPPRPRPKAVPTPAPAAAPAAVHPLLPPWHQGRIFRGEATA